MPKVETYYRLSIHYTTAFCNVEPINNYALDIGKGMGLIINTYPSISCIQAESNNRNGNIMLQAFFYKMRTFMMRYKGMVIHD